MGHRQCMDLVSGSSRFLVNDDCLLAHAEEYRSQCVTSDGGALRITKRGTVLIIATVLEKSAKVRLLNVYFTQI